GAKDAPKAERSKMETLQLTPEILNSWVLPAFQAPLRLNVKVRQIADDLREQGELAVISGVITLGILPGDKTLYLLDGQHRRAAALESGVGQFLADVRVKAFESMEEMAARFLMLNTPISRKTPDDQLRALQESCKPLKLISKECPYIGYRYIRANPEAPVIGMSAALRRWRGSGFESPNATTAGNAAELAHKLTIEDAEQLIRFMQIVFSAWRNGMENARLWAGLNMTLCMWLWRVLVLDRERAGTRRYVVLTEDQFRRCMMSVSADREYIDWLGGRNRMERDRAPAYRRLRSIF